MERSSGALADLAKESAPQAHSLAAVRYLLITALDCHLLGGVMEIFNFLVFFRFVGVTSSRRIRRPSRRRIAGIDSNVNATRSSFGSPRRGRKRETMNLQKKRRRIGKII